MTRQIKLQLELNENDLDALMQLLANPAAAAEAVAPKDPRQQMRIVDVLTVVVCGVSQAIGQGVMDTMIKQFKATAPVSARPI